MNNIDILTVHSDALVATLKNLSIHDFTSDEIYEYAIKVETIAKSILKKTNKGIIVNAKTLSIREGVSGECGLDEVHIKPHSKSIFNIFKKIKKL